MSVVTNIMISGLFDDNEVPIVEKQLKRLTDPFKPFQIAEAGGPKNLECDVYVAAFNYLDVDKFVTIIRQLEKLLCWNTYQDVQIFIKTQEADKWHVVDVVNLNRYDFL